jgi:hypothetical protein
MELTDKQQQKTLFLLLRNAAPALVTPNQYKDLYDTARWLAKRVDLLEDENAQLRARVGEINEPPDTSFKNKLFKFISFGAK